MAEYLLLVLLVCAHLGIIFGENELPVTNLLHRIDSIEEIIHKLQYELTEVKGKLKSTNNELLMTKAALKLAVSDIEDLKISNMDKGSASLHQLDSCRSDLQEAKMKLNLCRQDPDSFSKLHLSDKLQSSITEIRKDLTKLTERVNTSLGDSLCEKVMLDLENNTVQINSRIDVLESMSFDWRKKFETTLTGLSTKVLRNRETIKSSVNDLTKKFRLIKRKMNQKNGGGVKTRQKKSRGKKRNQRNNVVTGRD